MRDRSIKIVLTYVYVNIKNTPLVETSLGDLMSVFSPEPTDVNAAHPLSTALSAVPANQHNINNRRLCIKI
jgi:hypothetical protein